METPSINEAVFYNEVSQFKSVWTIFKNEIPTFENNEGVSSMALWSTQDRALNFTKADSSFSGFSPLEIPLELFISKWASDLKDKNLTIIINWLSRKHPGLEEEPEKIVEKVKS